MKPQTSKIKADLLARDDLSGKLALLKNAYADDTAYILTCGPSFAQYTPSYLRTLLCDKLVIAVKQTYNVVGTATDFHLLNAWNYQRFDYEDPAPIILFERHVSHPETPGLREDLLFQCGNVGADIPRDEKLSKRLCVTRNFEDFTFDKNTERPWGPGIMYELGFYLAVHIGVKRIVAVGWDIGDPTSCYMPHFYKEAETQKLERNSRKLVFNNQVYAPDETGNYSIVDDVLRPDAIYNIPGYYEDEVVQIAASTDALYDWLQGRGIALEIVSDRSIASPRIPRVSL